ncbi:MAG: tetratricopeptide repeat protein [Gammaproteobacteria bacterium]
MQSINDKLIEAITFQNQGNAADATRVFNDVLAHDANNAAALYSLALIAHQHGDNAQALAMIERGVAAAPAYAPMHFVRGAILQAVGRKDEALAAYDEALRLQPDYTEVLINSGALLRDMLRHLEALDRFNKVLLINPDHVGALANCAIMLTEFKQGEEAIKRFERLLQLAPDFDYGLGLLYYEQLHICDWQNAGTLPQKIIEGVQAGKRACKTLALMAVTDQASDHLTAAKVFGAHMFPQQAVQLWKGERYRHKKIRIAYISPDLREHPVGHLMAGIFERHDKNRFETYAYSLGPDDGSRLRARMLKAFDHFIDARTMGSAQIAQLMREHEIDVAIDLAGYTSDSRTDVFAYRPAPAHVNYLGYPGTLGVPYMDYILADQYVIPEGDQKFYTEQVVYLPDTYLPTDVSVQISERTPTRAECGLPETGTVFCSFSHDYKISPHLFDIWMRILQRVPDSVLWLMSRVEISKTNLRKEAAKRGIAPERLIFAERVKHVEDHLARYRQADVFLDTHPYNAHTTAADALMAGLPVVTYMGKSFPSRVAGSLLHAIGMTDLITHTLQEYEDLVVKLASEPALLADAKARIKANRDVYPLFDTERFCRNLEAVYTAMWRKTELGGARDALAGS